MQRQFTIKAKITITGVVALFSFSILLWEHFHGGVLSHHILNNKELPAISNWFNLILLPTLTWILLGRIEKRFIQQASTTPQVNNQKAKTIVRFIVGLLLGTSLAVSFMNDYTFFLDNVLYLFLFLSLVIPVYYAEFILGFILSMTYTFGAILPTLFILILASIGFLIYRFVRPMFISLFELLKKGSSKIPGH